MEASREKCLLPMFLRILLSTFLIVSQYNSSRGLLYRNNSSRLSSSSSSRRLDATFRVRETVMMMRWYRNARVWNSVEKMWAFKRHPDTTVDIIQCLTTKQKTLNYRARNAFSFSSQRKKDRRKQRPNVSRATTISRVTWRRGERISNLLLLTSYNAFIEYYHY